MFPTKGRRGGRATKKVQTSIPKVEFYDLAIYQSELTSPMYSASHA
jgi:hypothetical protein